MTPAITAAKQAGIMHRVHEYAHEPARESFGEEAAKKLGVPPDRVFKTLVVGLDNRDFAVAIVPVSAMLDLKGMAAAAGAKKVVMADNTDVERVTGYVIGGVSPLGQRKRLRTIIDSSAGDFPTIFVSAGRRGLEIELAPEDLRTLTGAAFARLRR